MHEDIYRRSLFPLTSKNIIIMIGYRPVFMFAIQWCQYLGRKGTRCETEVICFRVLPVVVLRRSDAYARFHRKSADDTRMSWRHAGTSARPWRSVSSCSCRFKTFFFSSSNGPYGKHRHRKLYLKLFLGKSRYPIEAPLK